MVSGIALMNSTVIGVGFGTAALGHNCYNVVTMALEAGFRKFDTAEADWWYDQKAVGQALSDFFDELEDEAEEDDVTMTAAVGGDDDDDDMEDWTCQAQELAISTKIPPWSLTSATDIRKHASNSREELVGFCSDAVLEDGTVLPYPLDVYFIHAPKCWAGWHPRCDNAPPTLNLRDTWLALEAVVGIDHSARRIGLSNIWPNDLLDIIGFVKERQNAANDNPGNLYPPPRLPDAVQAYADPLSPSNELREICEQHNIEFVSYSTLGTQHAMKNGGKNPVLSHPTVQMLAAKYSRSVAEVVLSWARQRNMSVIPRSSNRGHIAELARLLGDDKFLDENDVAAIDQLGDEEDEEL